VFVVSLGCFRVIGCFRINTVLIEIEFYKYFIMKLIVDPVLFLFLGVLLSIVASVSVFRVGYMREDLKYSKFMYLLYLFVFRMVFLLIRGDLVFVLLG
jgi:NADH:ubiquinone oxidoreductase subunit 5 (subunit L)/multisubunit Na+/H+ antiporter MnhA subunit